MDPAIRAMLEAADPHATKRLVEALDAVVGENEEPNWDIRLRAVEALKNRLYGKPAQAITDGDGEALRLGIVFLPPEANE